MYLYVTVKTLKEYYQDPSFSTKLAIEKATNEPTLVVPFEKLSIALVEELRPRAIIWGGFYRSFETFEAKQFIPMFEVIDNITIPMLCICGSHQLLGKFYQHNIYETERYYDDPIRFLTGKDEGPCMPGERAKYFYAHGFYQIHRVKEDPLFKGLGEDMYLKCLHYAEMKTLPHGFELLASSEHSKIEAMKHKEKPLYGLQFHAERYEEPFFDGKKILENFEEIVQEFWKNR